MLPEPIVGKYNKLTHKGTYVNPFRGPAFISQKGWLKGKNIFTTSLNENQWYFWDEYDSEYIGDLV